MEDLLIPISICVVLPVMIVWLVNRSRQNEVNRKTEIILKSIEAGANVDTNLFKTAKDNTTIKERLLKRVTNGCIFTLIGLPFIVMGVLNSVNLEYADNGLLILGSIFCAIGIALIVSYFLGKNLLAKEIEAEEKSIQQK